MDYAISRLEHELISLEDYLEEPSGAYMTPETQEQIEGQILELKQAIAILKQHSTKVPAAPPEFVRDYPHASD
jgi:hypothetical protein